MLSKQDYEKIAGILNRKVPIAALDSLIKEFADWLESDNLRFDRKEFYKACLRDIRK